jgi:sugar/nucleoside kinase (ribokinase family)
MNEKRQGITIAGSLIADVFYGVDSYPDQGCLSTVRETSRSIGGTGNIILDLAKMDSELTVKVCALIGQDAEGDALKEMLSKYKNVDTELMRVHGQTSTTLVMNAADTKQRTFFFIPAASDAFHEEYIDWGKVQSKIFHLEYLLLMKRVDAPDPVYGTHGAKILYEAKKRGMITSIDIVSEVSDRAKQVVGAALRFTDICCINEVEAECVTGIPLQQDGGLSKDNVTLAIEKLRQLGVGKWIVIHASSCAYGYDCENAKYVFLPSLELPKGYIKGTTGAGDAYCSGILYGAYREFSLEKSMRLARACAVCSLSENNGSDGMRSYDEILEVEKKFAEKV